MSPQRRFKNPTPNNPISEDTKMAKARKAPIEKRNPRSRVKAEKNGVSASQSSEIAQRGVRSSEDYRDLMCALMTDVVQGKIDPDVANAACNAGRGLLKMVEMEYRFSGVSGPNGRSGRSIPIARRLAVVNG
jgi:hypothetical protein